MKSIAPSILAFCVVASLIYLTGSFGNATFDISLWDGYDRGFVGFLGLFLGAAAAAATYTELEAYK